MIIWSANDLHSVWCGAISARQKPLNEERLAHFSWSAWPIDVPSRAIRSTATWSSDCRLHQPYITWSVACQWRLTGTQHSTLTGASIPLARENTVLRAARVHFRAQNHCQDIHKMINIHLVAQTPASPFSVVRAQHTTNILLICMPEPVARGQQSTVLFFSFNSAAYVFAFGWIYKRTPFISVCYALAECIHIPSTLAIHSANKGEHIGVVHQRRRHISIHGMAINRICTLLALGWLSVWSMAHDNRCHLAVICFPSRAHNTHYTHTHINRHTPQTKQNIINRFSRSEKDRKKNYSEEEHRKNWIIWWPTDDGIPPSLPI